MNLEEALTKVGDFGRYQRGIFVFNNLVGVAVTFQMLHMIFIGAKADFECVEIDLLTNRSTMIDLSKHKSRHPASVDSHSSHCYTAGGAECNQFYFTSNFTSIVTEWNLVCDRAYEAKLGQSMFMAGVLFGALFYGPVADAYGRRKTYMFTAVAAFSSSLGSTYANYISVFLAFRFLAGFNIAGTILTAFVLIMEIVGAQWRPVVCVLAPIFGSFAIASMALMAYIIPDWRTLSLIYSVSGFVMVPFFSIVPESPRWLYGKGRITEAEKVLLHFAVRNGKSDITEIELEPLKSAHQKSGSVISLVKNFTLLKITVIQMYTWFVNCVVYYGLTAISSELGSDKYVSVAISGLVEIPAYIIVLILLKYFGRRVTACTFMMIGGVACLCILLVPSNDALVIGALAMTGKLAITASFQIIYLWSAEIFPTVIRNASMGLMSMSARAGGVIQPMVNLLGNVSPPLPFLVYGVLTFSAGLLCFVLPETRDAVFPQTLDDMIRLSKGCKIIDAEHLDDDVEQRIQLLEERMEMVSDEEDVVEFDKRDEIDSETHL